MQEQTTPNYILSFDHILVDFENAKEKNESAFSVRCETRLESYTLDRTPGTGGGRRKVRNGDKWMWYRFIHFPNSISYENGGKHLSKGDAIIHAMKIKMGKIILFVGPDERKTIYPPEELGIAKEYTERILSLGIFLKDYNFELREDGTLKRIPIGVPIIEHFRPVYLEGRRQYFSFHIIKEDNGSYSWTGNMQGSQVVRTGLSGFTMGNAIVSAMKTWDCNAWTEDAMGNEIKIQAVEEVIELRRERDNWDAIMSGTR